MCIAYYRIFISLRLIFFIYYYPKLLVKAELGNLNKSSFQVPPWPFSTALKLCLQIPFPAEEAAPARAGKQLWQVKKPGKQHGAHT